MILHSNLVDIHQNRIYPAEIVIGDCRIESIRPVNRLLENYILPGFIDAHIHIESSMVSPAAFAEVAVRHGTVAIVSDPHEIANVLGMEGITFMVNDAGYCPMKIHFGAPSCVPATSFETSGAAISADDIDELLQKRETGFLSEVMDYPGVVQGDPGVMKKLKIAIKHEVPVDGHAPGLQGEDLDRYIKAGISTDHECLNLEEAEEKIIKGMKVLIREGSGAKNFKTLLPLLKMYPDKIMFCTDDLHPDDFLKGHINVMVKRAINLDYDLFDVIRAAGLNTIEHYGLDVGTLKAGDKADFIVVDSLHSMNVLETYINGKNVFGNERVHFKSENKEVPNRFSIDKIAGEELVVRAEGNELRVIQAIDGDLLTREIKTRAKIENGIVVQDIDRDILKIAVVNRYVQTRPGIGFISGFKLEKGAIASSIGHDCHNIICIGTSDKSMTAAINWVVENRGGIVVNNENDSIGLPLEIAGIMTTGNVEYAAGKYQELTAIVRKLGSNMHAPFMTLSFMALLVIPELKMSDKGLFSGKSFSFVSTFFNKDGESTVK